MLILKVTVFSLIIVSKVNSLYRCSSELVGKFCSSIICLIMSISLSVKINLGITFSFVNRMLSAILLIWLYKMSILKLILDMYYKR